uniref:Uncharacterized protein n=1 Tax=Anguilla anguilla TaxID=7936 RepID=A0A0E9PIP9_ANGAN
MLLQDIFNLPQALRFHFIQSFEKLSEALCSIIPGCFIMSLRIS